VSCCSHRLLCCVWGFEYLDLIRIEGLRIGGIDISFPLRRRYPYSILFDWLIRTTYSISFNYFILFLVNDTALNYLLIIPQVIYTNRKNLFQHLCFSDRAGITVLLIFASTLFAAGILCILNAETAKALDIFEFASSAANPTSIQLPDQQVSGCRNNSTCSREQTIPFVLPFP
jgi:hypothetical protein